jgi:predicted transcriptional regulator
MAIPFLCLSTTYTFSVLLCMDLNTYINRSTTLNINQCNQINKSLFLVNILYSIKLRDLNNALNIKCKTAAMGRVAFIFLNHFNSYRRNIKYDLMQLYNLQGYTATRALSTLVENGLIIQVGCKRKTNIGLYVGLDSYQITVKGKDSIKAINAVFESRYNKLA